MKIVVTLRATHQGPTSTETLPWLGPCDRAALLTGLTLCGPGDSLVALTAGPRTDEVCLVEALSAGVPRAVRLWDPCLEDAELRTLAGLMAAGLCRIGFDLILTGHRSADWGSGALGPTLAHCLGIPHVTSVVGVRSGPDDRLLVDHAGADERVSFSVKLPALLAVAGGPLHQSPPITSLPRIELMDLEDTTLRIPKISDAGGLPQQESPGEAEVLGDAGALLRELEKAGLRR